MRIPSPLPEIELIRKLYAYDAETGIFRNRIYRKGVSGAGDIAGSRDKKGYLLITIKRRRIFAHRAAWALMTGAWPSEQLDHINGVKSDNRFANLRTASNAQNGANRGAQSNSKTGIKGVSWCKERSKWRAQIAHLRKRYLLGEFDSIEDARRAYESAAVRLHREFAPAICRVA